MPFGDGYELNLNAVTSLRLKRCPHCQVANPSILQVHTFQSVPGAANLPVGPGAILQWYIYTCQTCAGIVSAAVLKSSTGQFVRGSSLAIEWLIPSPDEIDSGLPPKVAHYLGQAQQTLTSPSASIVMSAAAVDAILKEKLFVKDSLYKRIEQAATDGVITKEMAAVAHDVRLGANEERHVDVDAPIATAEDAQRSFEFAKALAEMIFVLPSRVKKRE